jgi:hypothetical protein
MSETMLLNVVGLLGFLSFIFGVWLFRSGKRIEKKMSRDYTTKTAYAFTSPSVWGSYIGLWPFGKEHKLWERHSTRPLAVLCIIVGIICVYIFAVSVLNLPLAW